MLTWLTGTHSEQAAYEFTTARAAPQRVALAADAAALARAPAADVYTWRHPL
jgi:ribosome-interacting GTPase 1